MDQRPPWCAQWGGSRASRVPGRESCFNSAGSKATEGPLPNKTSPGDLLWCWTFSVLVSPVVEAFHVYNRKFPERCFIVNIYTEADKVNLQRIECKCML